MLRATMLAAGLSLAAGAALAQSPGIGGVPNPLPTTGAGSTGSDASANNPTLPPAGTSLVATLPATPTRAEWVLQNRSTDTIIEVRDDGAGNNQTVLSLSGAATAGGQGGSDGSLTFKGRVRVYVPTSNAATDQVALAQY
jgi:hypothetical protein